MKNIIIFLTVILFLSLPVETYAQSVEYVGSTMWTGVSDVEVAEDFAHCAFSNGLVILDISNPVSPHSLAGCIFKPTRCPDLSDVEQSPF